jgi:hypothetical protein
MIDIVYICDKNSLIQTFNFENLMNENINSKEEVPSNWIGGEYYIQTCLIFLLEKKFKNNYFGITFTEDNEFIKNTLDNCKIIIVPGWIDDIDKTNNLYEYKDKLYSYTYFEKNFNNMKNLTSHKFNINTIPLYYYMIPLKTNNNDIIYKSDIKGMLMGKCISHNIRIVDHIINLLNLLDTNNIKLYSSLRNLKKMDKFPKYLEDKKELYINSSDYICNHNSIESLGILNPIKFRKLLQHCKYILCFDNPQSPPTIIEALFSDCIVISSSKQISQDLHNNKNIYLTDNMTNDNIISLIKKIDNDEIIFDKNYYPLDYTEESMENSLKKLIAI